MLYFEDPLDVTVIQIKNDDLEIINNVDFLACDMNYLYGYNEYMNKDIFALGYPFGDKIVSGTGNIVNIIDNNNFKHNIATNTGSSGSPIILLIIQKL